VLTIFSSASSAAVVWTGPPVIFSKAPSTDPTIATNQDRLTLHVWLTRGTSAGMFNIAPGQETSFSATSPKDTLWATSVQAANAGQTITASNYAALTFDTWQNAFGGSGSLGGNITTHDAVVHLLTDDIYLNLRFTSFTGGSNNGAFTYQRSTPVPEPATAALIASGLVLAGVRRYARVAIAAR
jgi:hypothetical protein